MKASGVWNTQSLPLRARPYRQRGHHLKPAALRLAHDDEPVEHQSGRYVRANPFCQHRLNRRNLVSGLLAAQRHMETELVKNIGVSPFTKKFILARAQPVGTSFRQLRIVSWTPELIKPSHDGGRQIREGRVGCCRNQRKKPSDHRNFKGWNSHRRQLGSKIGRARDERRFIASLGNPHWWLQRAMETVFPRRSCQTLNIK